MNADGLGMSFEDFDADLAARADELLECAGLGDAVKLVVANAVARAEGTKAPSAPTSDHASYLGASDLGAILGCDPFRTALDVWARKTGRVASTETSDALDSGNDHEAGIIAGAARRLRRAGLVERVDYPGPGTIKGGMVVGEGALWRGATLDAVAHHRDHGPVPLEAKMVGRAHEHEWGPDVAGGEAIPERVLAQVHWQALHLRERTGSRVPVAYVAADVCGTDRRLYQVEIDDETVSALLDAGRAWWARHVISGEIPAPTERDVHTLGRVFPRATRPLSPLVPDSIMRRAEEYAVASEYARRVASERDRVGALLRAELGDAAGYRWRGGRVTWIEDAQGVRRLRVTIRQPE